jgi:3-phosphoshikimate 1-carboxyvinyltransferase
MCFSLATFLGGPVRIDDPDCVAKTFPDYFDRFADLVSGTVEPDLIPITP